jgi:hypothetical protein
MRKRVGSVLVMLLCFNAIASADMIWIGGWTGHPSEVWDSTPNNFFDTSTGANATNLPTLSTNVPLPTQGGRPACIIAAGSVATANIIWIAPWADAQSLNSLLTMNGGTLTVANYLTVGSSNSGYFTMNGGNASIANLFVGSGAGSYGQLDMYGGQITGTNLGIGPAGIINFHNGGKIVLTGQASNATLLGNIEFWMGDGEINGATMSIVNGDIVLTPEPVTLALFGLGSLLALRRK